MNLIFMCVFHQESYVNLLKLLLTSISIKANIDKNTTDILIITSPEFQPLIRKELENIDFVFHYYILDLQSLFEAGCARLNIFKYNNINLYERILYLDTDILINSDINTLFNLDISTEKIYALEEGNIGHHFWGGQFFDLTKYDRQVTAFTSGILLFRNSDSIRTLFNDIQNHIDDYITVGRNTVPICLDQPFIVYNAITHNKYDNQLLKPYVENNPTDVDPSRIVYHFPGNPGSYSSKLAKMSVFWKRMIHPHQKTVLDNKKYSWQDHHIIFLENGKMDAFGKGSYTQEDTYLFQAIFGHRVHSLVFNNDYTEFTSTRQGDNQIVKGKLINYIL